MTTFKIAGTLGQERQQQLKAYLDHIDHAQFSPDKSNYAKGRLRLWLKQEWSLKDRILIPGYQDNALWEYCNNIYRMTTGQDADLALIAKGGIGIDWHRDDSYASEMAISINLSSIAYEWGFDHIREGGQPKTHLLDSGAITLFHCKHKHAALGSDPERYSINIWRLKDKYR